MTAYIRILLCLAAAVATVFVAILLVKLVVALAIVAALVFCAIYLYHFARAIARRVCAPRPITMIGRAADPPN